MFSVRIQVLMAVAFVAAWCVPFYVYAGNPDSSGLEPSGLGVAGWLVLYGGLSLLTGFIVRWPALVLPLIVYIGLVPLGVDPLDHDGWTYAYEYAFPIGFLSFFVVLIGWVAREVADAIEGRAQTRS